MVLSFPAGLYLLALLPVIVLAHLLHQRRRRRRVASVMLWRRLDGEQRRRPRWRKLLNRDLLLQLLAVILAAVALSEPMIPRSAPARRERQIILVDTSASMAAVTEEGARIELTRRALLSHLASSPENAEIALIELGRRARVRGTYTAGDPRLLDLVETLEATDEEGDLSEALDVARGRAAAEIAAADTTAGSDRPGAIHLFTDGAYTAAPGSVAAEEVTLHLTPGEPLPNRGITAFGVRAAAPDAPAEAFLAVEGDAPAESSTVRIYRDETLLAEQELPRGDGDRISVTIPLPPLTDGRITAELSGNDALAADDRAYAVLDSRRSLEVALFSPGNPFLETALAVHPRVQLRSYRDFSPEVEAAIYVLDRLGEVAIPRGRVLAFETAITGLPAETAQRLTDVTGLLPGSHPISRGLDFSESYLREATVYRSSGELRPLLTAEGDAVGYAAEGTNLRVVSFGFDVTGSTVPLGPTFPLLVARSLEWLSGAGDGRRTYSGAGRTGESYAAGESLGLDIPPGGEGVLTDPAGAPRRLSAPGLSVEYTETRKAGFYTLTTSEGDRHFAVNLLSSRETDLSRRLELPGETREPIAEATAFRKLRRYFAAAALALLLLELLLPRRKP